MASWSLDWFLDFLVPWLLFGFLGFLTPWVVGSLVSWFLDFSVYWFLGFLAGLLVSRLLDLLVSRFLGFLVFRFLDWFRGFLVSQCLEWFLGPLAGYLVDCMISSIFHVRQVKQRTQALSLEKSPGGNRDTLTENLFKFSSCLIHSLWCTCSSAVPDLLVFWQ